MASATVYQFKSVINDHIFFGPNNSYLAITQHNDIQIYKVGSESSKKLIATLSGHDEPITAIDISCEGLIVSSSQDRNAIVWKPIDASYTEFKKNLVLLRINRSATSVKWSPNGKKFAVGSGCNVLAICYYEPENDWWISKHLKKVFHSTILNINWHPNNILVSCGTTDNKCFVLSSYIKSVDEKPPPTAWGSKLPFNTICGTFNSNAWVHDTCFSPEGNILGFVSHDSSITLAYPQGEGVEPYVIKIKTNYAPFCNILFINENNFIVAGFNKVPLLYSGSIEGWKEIKNLDSKISSLASTGRTPGTMGSTGGQDDDDDYENTGSSALSMFKQLDLKGKVSTNVVSTSHINTVTSLKLYDGAHISTSGLDGKVVVFAI